MTAIQAKQRSFGAGEIAPEYHGHADYRAHQTGLSKCLNFVIGQGGGLTRRPPTRHVGEALPASRLMAMDIRSDDTYLLEFGHLKARLFRNAARVLAAGVPYEIITPFESGDLEDLRGVRSANVMYLTQPVRGLWRLKRNADTSWESTPFVFKVRPFDVENDDTSKRISASARIGTGITLTAHGFTFTANMVGEQIKFRDGDQRVLGEWSFSGTDPVAFGSLVRANGRVYENVNPAGGISGLTAPSHAEGVVAGGGGISSAWYKMVRSNFGVAEITDVAVDGLTATADVKIHLPEEFVETYNAQYGGLAASHRWSEQAFSARKGWPVYMRIQQSRLYLFGRYGYFWSRVFDYSDFTIGATPDLGGGEILGASSDRAETIKWAASGKTLIIGTAGEEYSFRAASGVSNGVSIADSRIDPATSDGSSSAEPVRARSALLHVGPDGRTLYEMSYNFQIDDFDSDDRLTPSRHLAPVALERLMFQRDPLGVIWMRRKDDVVVGFTYNPKQEIRGFHSHDFSGAAVTDICAVSNMGNGTQDVWLRTRRVIGGREQDSIEVMAAYFVREVNTSALDVIYLDAQVRAEGVDMTVVTGLAHLAGHQVHVVTNKGYMGTVTVDNLGSLALGHEGVTWAVVGLPYRSHAGLLPMAADAETGSTQGRLKQVKGLVLLAHGVGMCFAGNITAAPDLAERVFPPQPAAGQLPVFMEPKEGILTDTGFENGAALDLWTDGPFAFDIMGVDRVTQTGGH